MNFDENDLKNRDYYEYINNMEDDEKYIKSFSQTFKRDDSDFKILRRGFAVFIDFYDNEFIPFTACGKFKSETDYFEVELQHCKDYTIDEIEKFFYGVFEKMDCVIF